jgi:tetratricopeptide (TPR) repeat protein
MSKKYQILRILLVALLILQPVFLFADDDDDDAQEIQIQALTEKIEKNSKDVKSLYTRGMLYFNRGDYEDAVADLTIVCQLESKNFQAFIKCAEALNSIEDYDMAILTYSQALKLNAKSDVAYSGRANAKSANGDNMGAVEDYTEALKLRSKVDYNRARAWAYMELQMYKKAFDDFQIVVEKVGESDGGMCYCERGEASLGMGDPEGAIADFDKGIYLSEKAVEGEDIEVADNCYFMRGNAYLSVRNYSKAIADYTKAIKINDEEFKYYEKRAEANERLGYKAEARNDLNKAKRLKAAAE